MSTRGGPRHNSNRLIEAWTVFTMARNILMAQPQQKFREEHLTPTILAGEPPMLVGEPRELLATEFDQLWEREVS